MDGDEVDTTDVAQAMGFAGFGSQRPPKKRKFNPRADASVSTSSSALAALAASGANASALGQRGTHSPNLPLHPTASRSRGGGGVGARSLPSGVGVDVSVCAAGEGASTFVKPGGNADEIDLDDGGGGDGKGERREPQYIDTSRPARPFTDEEIAERELQARIDAIVTGTSSVAAASVPTASGNGSPPGVSGTVGGRSVPADGILLKGDTDQWHHGPVGSHHAAERDSGRPWWEGYTDPKFNENPWEKLEKELGLEPRGTWIPRPVKSV